jgi:hypothetical protein
MSLDHEYAVIGGLNRAAIGKTLGAISSIVAAGVTIGVLGLIDLAKHLGWGHNIPPVVMVPVTGGLVYLALYKLFRHVVWKIPQFATLLKVPNLGGEWICEGQTINPDKSLGYAWTANVSIKQDWDVIRVRLKTDQSVSNSVAAALTFDSTDGFRLLYNYRNEPGAGQPNDMKVHRGSAELIFNHALTSAEGEYFNGLGRFTFGTMKLTRKQTK